MPIPFTCPHCGKSMTVDDQFAGQTGPCANCRQPITIPAPKGAPSTGSRAGAGAVGSVLGVAVACLLGCLVCGGVGAVLMVPLAFRGPTAANSSSRNNLKQIMLALHNYHDVNGQFPPAFVTDADGKPLYSWRVLILPYVEEAQLYNRFDKSKAWDDPANFAVSNTPVTVFRSPLDNDLAPSGASYFGIIGAHTAFPPDRGARMADITDGTSNTIGIVELHGIEGSWAAPIDPKIESVAMSIGPSPGQLNPNGDSKLNVGVCDGSIRSLPATTPPQTLQLLFSRDDGMPAEMPD
jgi:uncharacterized protein DUF1559